GRPPGGLATAGRARDDAGPDVHRLRRPLPRDLQRTGEGESAGRRGGLAQGADLSAHGGCCRSALISAVTALINARWVNACGKLPSWQPVCGSICSAYSCSGPANDSSFSHSVLARSSSPINTNAWTSQNEQMVNVPSAPSRPSSVSSVR